MKLVKESINDILKPKSKDDIEISIDERLQELYEMDPSEMVESIAHEFDLNEFVVACKIIGNVEPSEVYKTIDIFYRDYL